MSLEHESEAPTAPENAAADGVGYRRATYVFPLYTVILIVFLVAVFVAQLAANARGAAPENADISVLLAGFVKQFFKEGQYWRILTGAALHGGLLHLFFNCYALYMLGKLFETLSSRAHLGPVFLLSALGGGILSLIFLPDSPSVGASGGIIGLLGYLTVYGYKRRRLMPEGFLNNMLFNIGFIVVVGVLFNVYARSSESENIPMVDNFGHLGGLVVGALYGLIRIPGDLYKDPREISAVAKVFGSAALGVFLLTCVFSILLLLGIVTIPFKQAGNS